MDFSSLKSASSKDFTSLVNAAQDAGGAPAQKKSYVDERQWKPTVDKSGNGYAVIRFLPQPAGEKLPWARYWDHGFQGPGGQWYIEKSLTSIGQPDPVGEANTALWNTGRDEDKALARARKRRLHYVTNIMVVDDPDHPENNGKVFLYQFGKKIYEKIMSAMQPEFKDETPMNPFDFWSGANFKIKIRNVEGYRNYDRSEFDSPSVLAPDEALEALYNTRLYSLTEWEDPTSYKTYEELQTRFQQVTGAGMSEEKREALSMTADEAPIPSVSEPVFQTSSVPEATVDTTPASEDDGDALSYFEQLARNS